MVDVLRGRQRGIDGARSAARRRLGGLQLRGVGLVHGGLVVQHRGCHHHHSLDGLQRNLGAGRGEAASEVRGGDGESLCRLGEAAAKHSAEQAGCRARPAAGRPAVNSPRGQSRPCAPRTGGRPPPTGPWAAQRSRRPPATAHAPGSCGKGRVQRQAQAAATPSGRHEQAVRLWRRAACKPPPPLSSGRRTCSTAIMMLAPPGALKAARRSRSCGAISEPYQLGKLM